MRSFSIFIFAALLGFTGCKPKEATVSGQMFVVTKGAENVKLGDVEVLLIEKSQATNFLQKKQLVIGSLMKSREQTLAIAGEDAKERAAEYNLANKLMRVMTVAMAESNNGASNNFQGLQEAQRNYNSFYRNSPCLSNTDFVSIK